MKQDFLKNIFKLRIKIIFNFSIPHLPLYFYVDPSSRASNISSQKLDDETVHFQTVYYSQEYKLYIWGNFYEEERYKYIIKLFLLISGFTKQTKRNRFLQYIFVYIKNFNVDTLQQIDYLNSLMHFISDHHTLECCILYKMKVFDERKKTFFFKYGRFFLALSTIFFDSHNNNTMLYLIFKR